ncbi:MAG: hypothetical protein CVU96_02480 [Firmicutes bacterium HGW-Firmicutes-20]|jgi:hypothetical protein|nr:MAG: hypothetical protein CVU96_02480 [Firmicutes bacterium HGW-Firmicutes-20]PKM68415.1 MAG: hypothetical protein CVU94_05435 [Firmicutes bacterium HGW-Firmicutes-19]
MIERILPKQADQEYFGHIVAYYIFVLISITSMIRSLIHVFFVDGGAGVIAGLNLSLGGENIVFAFGLWGVSQTIYALIQLLVAFRYKSLIPLMYVLLILETLGRMLIGVIKPPILQSVPPGGYANWILLLLSITMLYLSIKKIRE